MGNAFKYKQSDKNKQDFIITFSTIFYMNI